MPRKGARTTISKGVYRDGDAGPYEVRVVVGGVVYSERMPADSTKPELKAKRADLEATGRTETPRAERGTLRASVPAYLRLTAHLASVDDLADHLHAWCKELGDVQRHRITERDVLEVRNLWIAAGRAPKTVNNRVGTLRNLYRRLDGKKAKSPCDDVDPLHVPKTPIQRVSDALILAVDAELQRHEQKGWLRNAQTRARYRVFVSTGKRPVEIMRAQPMDVDLQARVWVPRDAKGGFCPGCYLNDDQLAAWRLFIEADAWGPYNHGNFGRVLRSCGWPTNVRPYQARHTMWITATERGTPLEDVSTGAGHRDMGLTRRFYTGILNGPLQWMSERMEGRFSGWPVVPVSAPDDKANR